MNRRRYTFEEILGMDHLLLQLALYEVAKGNMLMPGSKDDFIKIQAQTAKTFNYFKGLIRCGELTLEDLKDMVAQKNGAVLQNGTEYVTEQNADKVINDICDDLSDREKGNALQDEIGRILGSMFGGTLGNALFPKPSSGYGKPMLSPDQNPFNIKPVKKDLKGEKPMYNSIDDQKAKKVKPAPKKRKNSKKDI